METPIFIRIGDGDEVEVAKLDLGKATGATEVQRALATVLTEVAKALRKASR